MKPETQRQRAEFAAQLRVYSPKDPPILSTEALNDVCAVFHEDSKARRRLRTQLRAVLTEAMSVPGAHATSVVKAMSLALEGLED